MTRSIQFCLASAVFTATVLLCSASADDASLFILFKTKEPADWSGGIEVSPGKVVKMRGWRFNRGDKIQGNQWKVHTRRAKPRGWRARQAAKAGKVMRTSDNGLFISLSEVTADSQIHIQTKQGETSFKLGSLPYGKRRPQLKRTLILERCATSTPIVQGPAEEDYPAAVQTKDGTIWLTYLAFTHGKKFSGLREKMSESIKDFSYLTEPTGGDQLWLKAYRNGQWEKAVPVTPGGEDLYRPAIAIDGTGRVWVIYSKNIGAGQDLTGGNWELLARSYQDGKFSPPINISNGKGPDFRPSAVTDSSGRAWVTWMSGRNNNLDIFAAVQEGAGFGAPQLVSSSPANDWAPAIAADVRGGVTIAWDTYEKGDYDIYMRSFKNGQPGEAVPVAAGPEHDSRPSLAYDREGRLWIAWEQAGQGWGKDQGATERKGGGLRLYAPRKLFVRAWDGQRWFAPSATIAGVAPTKEAAGNLVAARKSGKISHILSAVRGLNPTFTRIAADEEGAIWVAFRGKSNMRHRVGSVFWSYLTRFDGKTWLRPTLLPDSDNILDNRPALLPLPGGDLMVIGASDERHKYPAGKIVSSGRGKGAAPSNVDPVNNNLYASYIRANALSPVSGFRLQEIPPEKPSKPLPTTPGERAAVQRMRDYRTDLRGEALQLVRGEFHRHTEISSDGGGDSALLDMWRYALDAASMDWIGNGDHDNGSGREYSWWYIQKTTDIFKIGSAFVPMFTYERSVSYPEGHRNVVFARRGVRTLPRLPKSNPNLENPPPAPDTQMLYRYLHQLDGICAEHTSGTNMGTDWRNNDSEVEPFVEIFQGARQNYEMPDAPRSNSDKNSIGGWRPKGFVSLALLRGYRLAFEASSDHGSTHMSYCNVWVRERTREAILEAMKKRRVYGSTDNILADVRCVAGGKEHFMGEEFEAAKPPTFNIQLHGTQPIAKVHIIRQNKYVYTASPNKVEVTLSWTDMSPVKGKTNYYYVRGEQTDGELVWVSPMWIKYTPRE